MRIARNGFSTLALCALLCVNATAQTGRSTAAATTGARERSRMVVASLTGVYRIDVAQSDRLYSVVAGASSSLPFSEQQRFFIDLTIRLTPPDQLAIERRGDAISIASSRAPRTSFKADGREQLERTKNGYTRVRAVTRGDDLVVSSRSDTGESYSITFAPEEGGRRLVVTRDIGTRELSQPVRIRSVYNRISDVAQWSIYGEPEKGERASPVIASVTNDTAGGGAEQGSANDLRAALEEWVAATNARDIRRQMSFYAPTLQAFYLRRNFPRDGVRAEKERVFVRARNIDIRAEEPEILFRDAGGVAVMRFRKHYTIEGGAQSRSGEVVQELRWRRTGDGWKIVSERDVRVIR